MVTMYSCANMASPNGGPYDETPPKFISSLPAPNQTNYKGKKVEILFDELVQLDKPSENVIITPPQMQLPVIRAAGKKVVVELKDTLKENTTYTIDFTNSISDNNEKNVFENFSFAFSTGDVIDTLEVSGILLNAENLEPMPGITIGLHKNLEDSAFVKLPFDRTSRTNDKGQFTIRNISPGSYRIFGLNDVNRDYKFDQPGEEIAFNDSIIIPSLELTTRQDTLWKDSLTIASSDKSTGSATETIAAECQSTVDHIAFITRGLVELLSRLGEDSLTIKIASENGPCSFQTDDDKNYVVIAMPVHIVDDAYYSEEEN